MQEKNKMSMEGFCTCVQIDIQHKLGDSYTVRLTEAIKNNGIKLKGLVITKENQNVSPNIYLESFYEYYYQNDQTDDVSLQIVEKAILESYQRNCAETESNLSFEFFRQWDKVKDRICCKVVGYHSNRELLSQVPHIQVLDLAVVFFYYFCSDELGTGTVQIYNSHMEMWDISNEELVAAAKENLPRLYPREVTSMASVMRSFLEDMDEEIPESVLEAEYPMHILSNRERLNGAIHMFDKDVLRRFSDRFNQSDIWIIPSSVHECLLIPDRGEEVSELLKMVKEVNAKEVSAEEVLSNSVYKFLCRTDEIVIGGMNCE